MVTRTRLSTYGWFYRSSTKSSNGYKL